MTRKTNSTRRARKRIAQKYRQSEQGYVRQNSPDEAGAIATPSPEALPPTPAALQSPAEEPKARAARRERPTTSSDARNHIGPAKAFFAFTLAFLLLVLLEAERMEKFLDTFSPDPVAETTASLIRDAAAATRLSELARREALLVDRFIDKQILGAKEEVPDRSVASLPPLMPTTPDFPDPALEISPDARQVPHSPPPEPLKKQQKQETTATGPGAEPVQQTTADQRQTTPAHPPASETVTKTASPAQTPAEQKAASPDGQPAASKQAEQPGHEGRKLVLLAGDSLMGEGFGPVLHRAISRYPDIEVKREAKYSTGLSRKDFFDWPQRMGELVEELKPDLVILCLGANDAQDIVDANKKRYGVGTAAWEDIYQERAESLLAAAQKKGAKVVWIGLPIMGKEPLNTRTRMLTLRQKAACESSPTAVYVDSYDVLKGADGKYAAFIQDATKKQIRIRYKDHVHVTKEGGDMLTGLAMPAILHELDVQENAPTTAVQEKSSKGPQAQASKPKSLPAKK